MQSEYVTAGLPYAEAFSRLKNDKMHVDNAMATMNKARNIENNPGFGQDVVSQLMNRDQILKELMLEVKSHPEFQSQYTKDKKIKAGEEVADAAQTVATAQMFQATNSFFHPRQ